MKISSLHEWLYSFRYIHWIIDAFFCYSDFHARSVIKIGEYLLKAGFWTGAIRPPTVPEGSARLRITLTAEHDEKQLDALLDTLAMALKNIGIDSL